MAADYGMEGIGSTKRISRITDSNKAAGFWNKPASGTLIMGF